MKNELTTLDSLNAKNLPELQGLKDKQLELVKECPFVEIVDNKSYELAKKNRTTLLKGRTSLESQDKLIASKLSAFRKDVKSVTDELILITLPHEEKQQEEVKRFEQIKENERLEKERIENERIENIKGKISEFENYAYSKINSWNTDTLKVQDNYTEIILESVSDFDFEEFDILYQQAKLRVQEHAENKVNSLTIQENQRIENERLAREKAESDAKLEAIQKQQEKERLEREEKEREEKQKINEVRKNRVLELGFDMGQQSYFYKEINLHLSYEAVMDADVIYFENILNDAKKMIQEAKDVKEKAELEKLANEKAILEAKKKSEKENKARVKRLSNDKKIISESLEVYFADLHLETENKESIEFIETANVQIQQLKSILLTQLNNL